MENKNGKNDNFFNKNPILSFIIVSVVVIVLFKFISPDGFGEGGGSGSRQVSYSQFKELISTNQLARVEIGEMSVRGVAQNGQTFFATKVEDADLTRLLDEKKITYSAYRDGSILGDIFSQIFPILIFVAILILFSRFMTKRMGGGMLGIGGAKKLVSSEKPKVKFSDVAGVDEAKEEVKEIVDFLKSPERYIRLGAKIPKGVLLVGPPGTGKTLLAKAVAGEADVPFFFTSGSSFIEMFVGVGASRVRELFELAKKEAPAIVFIDEIDAIGKSRAAGGITGGNDEREQTINQLLAEMDGFSSDKAPVIVLAATNRPEILDQALLRPGRFDRQVVVDVPDFGGRLEILKVHSKDVRLAPKIDLEEIARLTVGMAGADLANIINEAALLAGRAQKFVIEQTDLVEAIERVAIGLAKKSRRISERDKEITAYHESGHAVIAEITKGAMPVNKVTIVPRGFAGGYTLHTPDENKSFKQKHEMVAEIDCLLAGRAAEDVFLGDISTGASNDLERCTDIIKAMIGNFGMTDVAGLMVLNKRSSLFLGGGQSLKDYSDETAREVDKFVKEFLAERYSAVKESLATYKDAIEELVKALYKDETVEGSEVRKFILKCEQTNGLTSRLNPSKDEEAGGVAGGAGSASGAVKVENGGEQKVVATGENADVSENLESKN